MLDWDLLADKKSGKRNWLSLAIFKCHDRYAHVSLSGDKLSKTYMLINRPVSKSTFYISKTNERNNPFFVRLLSA
jgi:hypothetical protein